MKIDRELAAELIIMIGVGILGYMIIAAWPAGAEYRSYNGHIVDPQTGVSIHQLPSSKRAEVMRNAVDHGGRKFSDPTFDSFTDYSYENNDIIPIQGFEEF